MADNHEAGQPAAQTPPTPAKGLLILLAVVVLVAAYLGIVHAAGNEAAYAGFAFLLYWAGIDHMNLQRFVPVLVGSLFGLGVAYALHAAPVAFGTAGMAAVLVLVLAMIYCQVMGWLPTLINMATMLFLTIGTIPALAAESKFDHMAIAVLLSAAFFGGLVLIGSKFGSAKAEPAAGTAG